MPGEIGASMFSPRAARGYRFHSLQVEIMIAPTRLQRPRIALTKFLLEQRNAYERFPLYFERFTTIITTRNRRKSAYRPCSDGSRATPRFPLQIMASVAVWRAHRMFGARCGAITSARDATRTLAGLGGWEEDRTTAKNSRRSNPCKAKPKSIRFCVRRVRPRRFRAWSRS